MEKADREALERVVNIPTETIAKNLIAGGEITDPVAADVLALRAQITARMMLQGAPMWDCFVALLGESESVRQSS